MDEAMVIRAQHAEVVRVMIDAAGDGFDVMHLDDRRPRRGAVRPGELFGRVAAVDLAGRSHQFED